MVLACSVPAASSYGQYSPSRSHVIAAGSVSRWAWGQRAQTFEQSGNQHSNPPSTSGATLAHCVEFGRGATFRTISPNRAISPSPTAVAAYAANAASAVGALPGTSAARVGPVSIGPPRTPPYGAPWVLNVTGEASPPVRSVAHQNSTVAPSAAPTHALGHGARSHSAVVQRGRSQSRHLSSSPPPDHRGPVPVNGQCRLPPDHRGYRRWPQTDSKSNASSEHSAVSLLAPSNTYQGSFDLPQPKAVAVVPPSTRSPTPALTSTYANARELRPRLGHCTPTKPAAKAGWIFSRPSTTYGLPGQTVGRNKTSGSASSSLNQGFVTTPRRNATKEAGRRQHLPDSRAMSPRVAIDVPSSTTATPSASARTAGGITTLPAPQAGQLQMPLDDRRLSAPGTRALPRALAEASAAAAATLRCASLLVPNPRSGNCVGGSPDAKSGSCSLAGSPVGKPRSLEASFSLSPQVSSSCAEGDVVGTEPVPVFIPQQLPATKPSVEAIADEVQTDSPSLRSDTAVVQDCRFGTCVFLLPNASESDEFTRVTLEAHDASGDGSLHRRCVTIPVETDCSDQQNDHSTAMYIDLFQVGPVAALEDVQRRARRAQRSHQTMRIASALARRVDFAQGSGATKDAAGITTPSSRGSSPRSKRLAANGPQQFPSLGGLPEVDGPDTAASTCFVYVVKPFSNPKDEQRQLGPIVIIEASYKGPIHAHVPIRVVAVLEEPAELNGKAQGGNSDPLELGRCGRLVRDCLVQRGCSMIPVVSIEIGNISRHRWLLVHVSRILAVSIANNTTNSTSATIGKGRSKEDVSRTSLSLCPTRTSPAASFNSQQRVSKLNGKDSGRIGRSSLNALPTKTSLTGHLPFSSQPRNSQLGEKGADRAESDSPPKATASAQRVRPPCAPSAPVAVPSWACGPPEKTQPEKTPKLCRPTPPPKAETSRNNALGQVPAAIDPPVQAAIPPIQVGDLIFVLPTPDVAVRRMAEIWRPGAELVVVTTDHYGTPLFCPGGDLRNGLINLAPTGVFADGGDVQLVPLFWQYAKESSTQSVPTFPVSSTRCRALASPLEGVIEEEGEGDD